MNNPIIELRNSSKSFAVGKQTLQAVKNVNIVIQPGETFGLVGESGSGKTTVGRLMLKLEEPTSGSIFFKGNEITNLSRSATKPFRRHMQMVFQDPYAAFNPRMRVHEILSEGLLIHKIDFDEDFLCNLLANVDLNKSLLNKYPHELSGGQRQRIGIARALALQPEFVVLDEPLSALDVPLQIQIIELLKKLQNDLGLSYLLISHDIAALKKMAHRIGVMYLGEIVELATSHAISHGALHPYTEALLSAIPIPDPVMERKRHYVFLEGEPPSPLQPPKGCPFHTRCPMAMPMCAVEKPLLKEVTEGHFAACHLF